MRSKRWFGMLALLVACSPERVTWQQLIEAPLPTHEKLGGPALRDCLRTGNPWTMKLTAKGSLHVCPYNLESSAQPSGPWRIASVLFELTHTHAPQAVRADPTGLVAEAWLKDADAAHVRKINLRDPTGVSLTQDVPARLGLQGFLPAAPIHPEGARWLRPDAKPGEVYLVRTQRDLEQLVHIELHVLPRDTLGATLQLKLATRPMPAAHAPVAMSTRLTAEEGVVLMRLSRSGLFVGDAEVSPRTPEALRPVLDDAVGKKRREKQLLKQSYDPTLAIDAQRSMAAAAVTRWIAQIVTTHEHLSRIHTRGVPRNTSDLPGLSTHEHVRHNSIIVLVRDANKPPQDATSLRVEVHPEGIHIGRSDEGEPVAWFDPDPACAPYQICRTQDRVTLKELAKLDAAKDWAGARDAYERAFASVSPVALRTFLADNATEKDTMISLIAADPELSWQTYESLRYALQAPLQLHDEACETGLQTPKALLFARRCSKRDHKLPTYEAIIALIGDEAP